MNSIVRISGIALAALAVSWSWSEAQAGGHRRGCYNYQPSYVAPATTYSTAPAPLVTDSNQTVDGRQRYQSAYQAPAATSNGYYAPATTYYNNGYYSGNYNGANGHSAIRFQDRPFEEQVRADKKIRGL